MILRFILNKYTQITDSLDKCLSLAYFIVGSILGPRGTMENMIAFLSHGQMRDRPVKV